MKWEQIADETFNIHRIFLETTNWEEKKTEWKKNEENAKDFRGFSKRSQMSRRMEKLIYYYCQITSFSDMSIVLLAFVFDLVVNF